MPSSSQKGGTTTAVETPPEAGSPETTQTGTKADSTAKGGANNPPVITRGQLKSENTGNTDLIKVLAEGSDKDEDEVTFTYEWTKNGDRAGDSNTITGFKRGDKISVKITPYDGKDYGQPKTLYTKIVNANPKIFEHKEAVFDGRSYSYQVKATDPDGDPLSYSLKAAPAGMAINPNTGLIQWSVPPDFKGRTQVTIAVSDGHGGEASQSFSLEIKPEQQK